MKSNSPLSRNRGRYDLSFLLEEKQPSLIEFQQSRIGPFDAQAADTFFNEKFIVNDQEKSNPSVLIEESVMGKEERK